MQLKLNGLVCAEFLGDKAFTFAQCSNDDQPVVLVATGESGEYLCDYCQQGELITVDALDQLPDWSVETEAKLQEYRWFWPGDVIFGMVKLPVAAA